MKFQKLLKTDVILEKVVSSIDTELIKKRGQQNKFTYLIGLIIGQRIRYNVAKNIRSKLYSLTSFNFTPDDILKLEKVELKNIGISNNKITTIIETCKFFKNNKGNEDDDEDDRDDSNNNDNMDFEYDDSNKENNIDFKKLQNIKGIGSWTIDCFKIEYNLVKDFFPTNDKYVNNKLIKLYGIKKNEIPKFVEKWKENKSEIFWYLWKYQL